MIDAASDALDGGKVDSVTIELHAPNYHITVSKGAKTGTGVGRSEEEAYENALDDMSGGNGKKTAAAAA